MIDLIDYIQLSPYKPLSSATRAYRRLYRQSIILNARQLLDFEEGFIDPDLKQRKRILENKIYKIRNCIPTKPDRDKFRKTPQYKSRKIQFFNKAVYKQLNIEKNKQD
jgi:hypothetical protein